MNRLRQRKNKTYYCCISILMGIVVNLFSVIAEAAEKPPGKPLEKVRIVYGAISASQAVVWVALEAGFFRKYGLDVELIFVEGGPRAVQMLTTGEVPFAQVAGAPVIQRNLQGSDVVMIAGFMNTFDYQFVVAKNITQPDQLKGKAVAVSRAGSSSDFATRYALEKYGLEPNKDVTIVEIGSQPARFAALEAGKIQGVMVAVPLTLKAKKMGFNILADLQMLGLEYQYTALATTQELIKTRANLVRNVVKACVEAIHYLKTHRKEAYEVFRKYLKTTDPEALAETYEAIVLALIPEKPYPTLLGIDVILRELAAKEPKARTARPEQFVDMFFVRELDRFGLIDDLYKARPVVVTREVTPPAPTPEKERKAKVTTPVASASPSGLVNGREYIIKAGDTLSHLALRFYGAASKWPRIYEGNTETIKNPHYIYIGQKIIIPA